MDIQFHPLTGPAIVATLPYDECRHVLVKGRCPVCSGQRVIIAHDIHATVIFAETDRARALAHLAAQGAAIELLGVDPLKTTRTTPEGGALVEELVDQVGDGWKVMGIDGTVGEYSGESRAVCLRGRSHVGRLHVTFDTLFGRTEDNLIMSGRYGLVI